MIRKGFFFFFLLALDIASKIAALEWIPPLKFTEYPFGGIALFSQFGISFSLNCVANTGAAWGLFPGHPALLFAFRAVVILGLIAYLLVFHRGETPRFPLWLIATGAIGNALDFLFYGYVVDFLHFVFWGHSFPLFNFADSYITCGVLGSMIFARKTPQRTCPNKDLGSAS